ncbi:MAG: hypothetical protein EYC70_17270 [Planctomycetota bacterium]|nr:MAG: hypothetical protein EYC70_17270 [Planctomycetota bacterium]
MLRSPGRPLALGVLVLLGSCSPESAEETLPGAPQPLAAMPPGGAPPGDSELAPPPFSDGIFPCSDCHTPDLPVNTERRALELAHQEIELRHDEEHRWCLDCHDAQSRDNLHLAGGMLVPFEESFRLCGQCHGDKYRDWRAGVHGRRTGQWNGAKKYLLCVNCHNAHHPAFEPLQPQPPPLRPGGAP